MNTEFHLIRQVSRGGTPRATEHTVGSKQAAFFRKNYSRIFLFRSELDQLGMTFIWQLIHLFHIGFGLLIILRTAATNFLHPSSARVQEKTCLNSLSFISFEKP